MFFHKLVHGGQNNARKLLDHSFH